jgi:hypothetical protein
MDASLGEDRPGTTDPDPNGSLRMRTATADAAFVADGIALGLRQRWAGPTWRPITGRGESGRGAQPTAAGGRRPDPDRGRKTATNAPGAMVLRLRRPGSTGN